MVNAAELTTNSIKKAIMNGNFYASQGPLFESVVFDKDSVEVRCTRVETVIFYSNTVGCSDRVSNWRSKFCVVQD